jgi:hypothetical protein
MKTICTFAAAAVGIFLALNPAWSATYHYKGSTIHGIIIRNCHFHGPIIHGIIIHKCHPIMGVVVMHPPIRGVVKSPPSVQK